jgi:HK97 family phage portal protein
MSLITRIREAFRPPERRAEDISWRALSALSPLGVTVNARAAENLAVVLSCVSAISTAIASLPVYVYRRTDTGREVADDNPLMRLTRTGPNEHQSWPDFCEWLLASTLLQGNGLAEIVRDGAGRVTGLRPAPWGTVSVQLLPSGRLAYDVSDVTYLGGGTGRTRRLLEGEALHVKDRSDDGLIGRSRLSRAAAVVAHSLSQQAFASAMFENGVNPSGVLEADGKLGLDALASLRTMFRDAFSGPSKAAKAMVLDQGLKWKSVSVSPEDAELLASRRFTGEELARLYNVPPPIIGDLSHGTFTNSETLIRFFAQSTLSSWCRKLEAEFSRTLLSAAARATHEIEIDLSGLLRGDPETRWKSHEIAVRSKILTPNEVRESEGWNRRDGGDEFERTPAPAREAA